MPSSPPIAADVQATGDLLLERWRDDHLDAGALEHLAHALRHALVGDQAVDPLERAEDQAAARLELAAVDQHDQLFGLAQHLLLGLDQERVALDQPLRAHRLRAREHAGGVEMVDHGVALVGAEHDVLRPVDLAARQDHAVLGLGDQRRRHGERVGEDLQAAVGQELGHPVGRGAAVDDDRIAVGAKIHGRLRDPPLLIVVERLGLAEGARGEPSAAPAGHRLGAAVHFPELARLGEPGEVAAHGRGRCVELIFELDDGHHAALGERFEDPLVTLAFVHESSLMRPTIGAQRPTVNQKRSCRIIK